PGLLPMAALGLAERRPSAVGRAVTSRCPLRHRRSRVMGLAEEEAAAELGAVGVDIGARVRAARLLEFGVGDRRSQPAVVGLAGEFENPARHRDGDPVSGDLLHERVEPSRGGWPGTGTRPPGAGPRSPAPAARSASWL